ncbi:MAG: phenylacetate--CoA ligase family protein [Deltaproteobacteria bacterium]|nr:phenylacetate--CoA ligase family protein [Deltaproteobacteria bacterium]
MSSWLFPRIVLPLYEHLTGRRLWTGFRDLMELQWRSAEELEERALKKLQPLLIHAATHVPYYRELFKLAAISPGEIRTAADLAHIPITTKADLRKNFPTRTTAENIPRTRRWKSRTSGSTGLPFEFYEDRASIGPSLASYLFFRQWAGVPIGDSMIYVGSVDQFGPTGVRSSRFMHAARRIFLGERIVNLLGDEVSTKHLLAKIAYLPIRRPYFVWGAPSYIASLATQIIEDDIKLPIYPKAIICFAETLTPTNLEIIERAFRCRVVNHYSCFEIPHMAQTCPDHAAVFHINSELVVIRVVREDGSSAIPGERGRTVITDLSNYVMPFVNYDLGDFAVQGSPCPCGRGFPTLQGIEGRTTESIQTPSGTIISGAALGRFLLPYCLSTGYIWEYQAVQITDHRVVLRVVPAANFSRNVTQKLERELERFLGPGLSVQVEIADRIPPEPSGKRLIIKSCLNKS